MSVDMFCASSDLLDYVDSVRLFLCLCELLLLIHVVKCKRGREICVLALSVILNLFWTFVGFDYLDLIMMVFFMIMPKVQSQTGVA